MVTSLSEYKPTLKLIAVFSLLFWAIIISSTVNAATRELNSSPSVTPLQIAYVTTYRHVVRHPVYRHPTVVRRPAAVVVRHPVVVRRPVVVGRPVVGRPVVVRRPVVRHPVARHQVRHIVR